ncbi:hypothetical protein RJ640_011303 [Escallonia rubra]|uniref:Uncharacterized protein n=1 Tax=Escallonia rubra TaxID=112253 RepID=A0AA88R0R4_9ASTE|nr:hypothetical protein RJ640_011305 [Escallonia rubra]KAK2988040.1 hypothetical protein RJ640_011303 [Escallonia rubra]
MTRMPENVKDDQGSISIGATGKVSTLMMQELDSIKRKSQSSVPCKRETATVTVSISCGSSMKRIHSRKAPSNCASSSSSTGKRRPGTGSIPRKVRNSRKTAQLIPMLDSEDISIERTPISGKNEKKLPKVVEIVDLKCGNHDREWSSPISNRLKKLSFSSASGVPIKGNGELGYMLHTVRSVFTSQVIVKKCFAPEWL